MSIDNGVDKLKNKWLCEMTDAAIISQALLT